MDGNRRDSGCCPFFAHVVIRTCPAKGGFLRTSDQMTNLSGGRLVFTDECDESTCPVEGGFSRTSHIEAQLVR